MRVRQRISIFLLFLVGLPLFFGAWAAAADTDQGTILVGRIAHLEGGKLLRYVPENQDWVATVKDAPFGLEDAMYAENGVKAESIMPNRTWIRIGGDTQLQMIALDPETTTVDVASGLARMYNKNPNAIIKATTPFGYVVAPEGTVFDLYVGDQSMEVIAVRGTVDFVHQATGERYEVRERDASLIADSRSIASGNGTVDAAWDDWNGQRDSLWANRLRSQGPSANYLPEPIRDESYALEENGRWEQVYYEGESHSMWRPSAVDPGWSPYTEGRWTVYYGDNCWIPSEPFGYVTHHYGSWVWVDSYKRWYWLPPTVRAVGPAPRLFIAFGWYPGRVGWMHSGSAIGWIPLAPDEPFYGHRAWGPRVVVINRGPSININIGRYRYLDRAVVISPDHLYRGVRYTPYVQRLSRTAILNSYKPAAVIDRNVIRTFDTDHRRFAFNDAKIERKPHAIVLNRINDNRRLAQSAGTVGQQQIRQDLGQATVAALPAATAATAISAPVVSSRMVGAAQVNQPVQSLSFAQQELKPKDRQRPLNAAPAQMTGQRGLDRPVTGAQDDARRIQSVRDARDQVMQRNETMAPAGMGKPSLGRPPALQDQGAINQGGREPVAPESGQRLRSPRELPAREQAGPSWQPRQQPREPVATQQAQPQTQPQAVQQTGPSWQSPSRQQPREPAAAPQTQPQAVQQTGSETKPQSQRQQWGAQPVQPQAAQQPTPSWQSPSRQQTREPAATPQTQPQPIQRTRPETQPPPIERTRPAVQQQEQ
ncbi:MAG: hypothetical protein FWC49_06005, partial [Proteobacteria bacterium]|nr:hypothetical protein [Pseudomonadota bacterium]